jgi:2-methylisocitrate lyase-like PEP mutase family enzyme
MMAGVGFAALATSSGASAGLLGRRDGRVTRDEALAQARVICDATDLPVSADLEKGFGDAPEIVAETIRLGVRGTPVRSAAGHSRCGVTDAANYMPYSRPTSRQWAG